MALDYGERRVGVAITDPTGMLAQPLETIEHRGGHTLFERLDQIVEEYEVNCIVLGLPLHMDGSSGEQVARTRRFGAQLTQHTGLPVEYLDERWTTREAQRAFGEAGTSKKKRRDKKTRLDPVAASLLLRTWLDRSTD